MWQAIKEFFGVYKKPEVKEAPNNVETPAPVVEEVKLQTEVVEAPAVETAAAPVKKAQEPKPVKTKPTAGKGRGRPSTKNVSGKKKK